MEKILIYIAILVLTIPYFWCFLLLFPPFDTIFWISNMSIYEKMGHSGRSVIVPFYSFRVLLSALNLSQKNILLLLVPLYNWYVLYLIFVRLSDRFNKSRHFSFGLIFLPWIFFPILALSNNPTKEFNTRLARNSFHVGLFVGVFLIITMMIFIYVAAILFSKDKASWIFLLAPVVVWVAAFIVDILSIIFLDNDLKRSYNLSLFKIYLPALYYILYFIPCFVFLVYSTWWSDHSILVKTIGTLLFFIALIRLGGINITFKTTYLAKVAFRNGEKKFKYRNEEYDVEKYTLN